MQNRERVKLRVIKLSDADVAAARKALQPVVDKWVADTPAGALKLRTFSDALAEYRKDH